MNTKKNPKPCPLGIVPRHNFLSILVVEDEYLVADMLEAALQTWGYEVYVARNGKEAMEVLATRSVDGMLLDMHMPIMDGRTVLDELRWAGFQFPVWVMSGGSDAHVLRQLLHEGAQGFFIKPFGLQSLKYAFSQTFLIDQSLNANLEEA